MIKRIVYFFFALSIISCSTSDEVLEEQNNLQQEDLQPEKILPPYVYTNATFSTGGYFKCIYDNGRLSKIYGKYVKSQTIQFPDTFNSDTFISLTYNNDQVKLEYSDNSDEFIIYETENNRPVKSELYVYDELVTSTKYTYESDKIMIYKDTYNKNREEFITYFFDSNKNLTKSEKLEKSGGVETKLTVTNYSNFDHAKNPFKKLSLINDNFFEKSLSANN
ncbi:hypothetical protein VUJ46_18790 [Chryseobacterium sp. MYb264]|uniref:hypothetical protein n=1 Tax=Chryseobacterium sp. MYb264 TaxID=2745153 RepID=UPI002E151629|nr:hypothetical protein VUJ46_18790 [Chryseobacterium sp. MYb264]